jgi:hypothetical protein
MTETTNFDNVLNPSYSFGRFVNPIKSVALKINNYAVEKAKDWFYFHEVLGQNGKKFIH